jgi:hypothetical protein
MTHPDKFWKSLKTSTRNSLKRYHPDMEEPWLLSVKELIRIPGIGPAAIAEIARLTERYCV